MPAECAEDSGSMKMAKLILKCYEASRAGFYSRPRNQKFVCLDGLARPKYMSRTLLHNLLSLRFSEVRVVQDSPKDTPRKICTGIMGKCRRTGLKMSRDAD